MRRAFFWYALLRILFVCKVFGEFRSLLQERA
jgi:hypothetical protein